MEHRWGQRIVVSLDAIIHSKNGFTRPGTITNINCDGMYIHSVMHGLQKGMVIDAKLATGCYLRGWVMHVEDKGIGVMFISSAGCKRDKQPLPMSKQCRLCLDVRYDLFVKPAICASGGTN